MSLELPVVLFFPYEKGKSLPIGVKGFGLIFVFSVCVSRTSTLELPAVGSYLDQCHLSIDVASGNALWKCSSLFDGFSINFDIEGKYFLR